MKESRVEIPGRAYSVFVGDGILERAHELIEFPDAAEKCVVVSDAIVRALHGERARAGILPCGLDLIDLTVQPGEATKSAEQVAALWRALAASGVHRRDVLIALGGGVVGDLAGFAAATYHRGIAFVQAPTTLLAMVDASIGGKTAVNIPEGKNLVGAFHQPRAVIADTRALQTLPEREFTTGMAEAIKHGLIDAGPLLGWLQSTAALIAARDPDTLDVLVADAAAVKIRIVSEDETEQGRRAHLNYGHTLGHAIEALDGYSGRAHGEAVAIGMMFVAHLAPLLGFADRVADHRAALERFGMPVGGAGYAYEDAARAWAGDKKYEAGARFVVLSDLGEPMVVRDVPEDALRRAYEAVR